ncbi:MAG: hydrogenase maturation protease [Synechococcaceae cyanobacterium]|nr:hydrogenase maturation protease [Synechococcaceae cyanobacterium]
MSGSLVIGIGNPLRGDDGVAWRLLEELEAEPSEGVTLRRVQQLTPELAAELAAVERVLFVDAWCAPEGAKPSLHPLAPASLRAGMNSHRLEPGMVLALVDSLYGGRPLAFELLVPGTAFGHGTAFSADLDRALPMARLLLRNWMAG